MIPLFGELSALITAVLWSFTSIFFSEAAYRVGSWAVNITRLLLAAVFLLLTILIMSLPMNLSSSQLFNLFISGVIGLVFGDTYLFKSFQHIGARLSMLIMSLSPVIAAVLAFFFLGETISLIGIIGIVVTIIGIAIVVLERGEVPDSKYKISKIGIFYGFLGALGQGAGLIFAKQAFLEGEINGFVATFIRIISSVIIILPMGILTKKYGNPLKIYKGQIRAMSYTLAGSVTGPFLGITFSLIAIAYTKVGIASTIMATVPILMLPMVIFFYKERLSWKAIAGAFITVGGLAVLFLS